MTEENTTCIRIPGNLDHSQRLKIDTLLNEAAGGDYITHITRERLVDPSTGFTLNEGCHLDLCLAFKVPVQQRAALSVRGVQFLPSSSALTMNLLR
jgi:hypothetical protein